MDSKDTNVCLDAQVDLSLCWMQKLDFKVVAVLQLFKCAFLFLFLFFFFFFFFFFFGCFFFVCLLSSFVPLEVCAS